MAEVVKRSLPAPPSLSTRVNGTQCVAYGRRQGCVSLARLAVGLAPSPIPPGAGAGEGSGGGASRGGSCPTRGPGRGSRTGVWGLCGRSGRLPAPGYLRCQARERPFSVLHRCRSHGQRSAPRGSLVRSLVLWFAAPSLSLSVTLRGLASCSDSPSRGERAGSGGRMGRVGLGGRVATVPRVVVPLSARAPGRAVLVSASEDGRNAAGPGGGGGATRHAGPARRAERLGPSHAQGSRRGAARRPASPLPEA